MKLAYLQPGDVLHDGTEHVVEYLNDSRARLRPLAKDSSTVNVATTVEPGTVRRRIPQAELNNFLTTRAQRNQAANKRANETND